MAYTYTWKIRSGDTDFSGLVYTPEVINCITEAAQDFLSEVGFSITSAQERGVLYPAVHAEADYLGPMTIDDRLTIEMTPEIGSTSVTFHTTGTITDIVFEGQITLVFVDAYSMDPLRVPEDVRGSLAEYQDERH